MGGTRGGLVSHLWGNHKEFPITSALALFNPETSISIQNTVKFSIPKRLGTVNMRYFAPPQIVCVLSLFWQRCCDSVVLSLDCCSSWRMRSTRSSFTINQAMPRCCKSRNSPSQNGEMERCLSSNTVLASIPSTSRCDRPTKISSPRLAGSNEACVFVYGSQSTATRSLCTHVHVQIPGGDMAGIVEETGTDSKVRPKQSLK